MIEIKVEKDEQKEQKHNPLFCNIDTEQTVHFFTALGEVSKIISDHMLNYEEFWGLVARLDHFYQNWAEINDIDLEDEEERLAEFLPSILDEFD